MGVVVFCADTPQTRGLRSGVERLTGAGYVEKLGGQGADTFFFFF